MNRTRNSARRVKKQPRRRFNKSSKIIKTIAVGLAVVIGLSFLNTHLSSIVDLMKVDAAEGDDLYPADITLYDYYSDYELMGCTDDKYDNCQYSLFNRALYDSGYSTMAGTQADWATGSTGWSTDNLKNDDATNGGLNYFPLYLGLQYPTNTLFARDPENKYNYSMIVNSESNTGESAAAIGLVDPTLSGGVLTQGGGMVSVPYFDSSFIQSKVTDVVKSSTLGIYDTAHRNNIGNKKLGRVSSKGTFQFRKIGDLYQYNSYDEDTKKFQGLKYTAGAGTDLGTFEAGEMVDWSNGGGNGTYYSYKDSNSHPGFFPWNYYDGISSTNYERKYFGYAAKFEISFSMSESGKLTSGTNSGQPITFNFKGDDDVWVFIDDQLVLDVGGAHGAVSGNINFQTKQATTNYIKSSNYYNTSGNGASYAAGSTSNGGVKDLSDVLSSIGLYDDATKTHVITVYYVERGTLESNCYISFNFQIADTVSIVNKIDTDGVNPVLKEATDAVAALESMAYRIQSNGETSTVASPDAETTTRTYDYESDFPTRGSMARYTLKFITDPSSSPPYLDDTYVNTDLTKPDILSGTTVKLPQSECIGLNPGYYVAGWKLLDGSGNPDTRMYNSYNVKNNATFVAVWKQLDLKLTKPNKPIIILINNGSGGKVSQVVNGSPYVTDGSTTNDTYTTSIYNATQSNSTRTFEFNWGTLVLSFSISEGNIYGVTANGSSLTSAGSQSISGYSATSFGTSTTNSTWTKKYIELYQKLDDKYASVMAAYAAGTGGSAVDTYIEALNAYPTMLPTTHSASTLQGYIDTIDGISGSGGTVTTTTTYAYDYTDTVSFYIYSLSGTPSVSITNGGSVSTSPTIDVTKLTASSEFPAGANTTYYPKENYYLVTVPQYIVKTVSTSVNGTVVSSDQSYTQTQIKAANATGLKSENLASRVAASTDGKYYCYYICDGEWRDITSIPSVIYSNDTTLFWVYSQSDVAVSYYAENGRNGVTERTAVATGDTVGYCHAYEIPKTVYTITGDTSIAESVRVSIDDAHDIDLSSVVGADAAYCYAIGNNLATNKSWCKLVTVFSATSNGTGLYAYRSDTGYPDTAITFTGCHTMEPSSDSGYYYCYLPYNTGVNIMHTNGGSSEPALQNNDQILGSSTPVTSGTMYYDTATYKAITHNAPSSGGTSAFTAGTSQSGAIDPITYREPPVSGSGESYDTGNKAGQFEGDSNTSNYITAAKVNFKLFDTDNAESTNANSVVRQTASDGKFYLHNDQTAKFTYQFQRKKGLRIAQTGDSTLYTPTYITTVTDSLPNHTTILPNAKRGVMYDATLNEGAGNASSGLFNRYRTTWVLTDKAKGNVTSKREDYNVYLYGTAGTDYTISSSSTNTAFKTSYVGDGALYFDNIIKTADANTGIALTATFTNTVITGDLYIKKILDADAIKAIENYRGEQASQANEDPEFTFHVDFYNIFGGTDDDTTNDEAISYKGDDCVYYVKDEDGYYYGRVKVGNDYVETKYKRISTELDEDGNRVNTYKVVGAGNVLTGSELTDEAGLGIARIASDDYTMTIKYSESAKTDGSAALSGGTVKMLVIEYIPVATEYVVKEKFPEVSGTKPDYDINKFVLREANSAGTMFVVPEDEQDDNVITTKDYSDDTADTTDKIKGTIDAATKRMKITSTLSTNPVGKNNAANATYYTVVQKVTTSGSTTVKLGGADSRLDVFNKLARAYLIIGKKIDHLYYNEKYNDEDNSDDPAGLFGTGMTVGGQTPGTASENSDDINGYQRATDAVQTFIYKIEEFKKKADGDTDADNDGYADTAVKTIYETISFGSDDAVDVENDAYKFRIIEADSSCKYVITELTDWSWKYSATALTVSNDDENTTTGYTVATIYKFDTVSIPIIDATGSHYDKENNNEEYSAEDGAGNTVYTKSYTSSAWAKFTNEKNSKRDVEGDTCVEENSVPASAS